MNICMVTNQRNSSIFSRNMIAANTQLGNCTEIFELDYDKGSLSNVGVFTLRVFFGTNHSYGWCHSFCSKVEYVL